MLEIFDEIVGPAAKRFKPDIILVIHPSLRKLQRISSIQYFCNIPSCAGSSSCKST